MYYFFVMLQLLRRDLSAFGKRFANYGLNFFLISPLLSIITLGYIQPALYFPHNAGKVSIVLMVGTFVFNIILLCYNFIHPLMYDIESDRFIDYLALQLPFTLLLLEMILFPAILAICLSFPFFLFAYLLLPHYFIGLQIQWFGLFGVIVATALAASTYIMTIMAIIRKSSSIRQFWLRVNWPLVVLGGFWIPWHLLIKFSPLLARIALIDPILYMTEGIRSALLGSDQFIPYYWCIVALLVFSCIFICIAHYFFKKKLDYI